MAMGVGVCVVCGCSVSAETLTASGCCCPTCLYIQMAEAGLDEEDARYLVKTNKVARVRERRSKQARQEGESLS